MANISSSVGTSGSDYPGEPNASPVSDPAACFGASDHVLLNPDDDQGVMDPGTLRQRRKPFASLRCTHACSNQADPAALPNEHAKTGAWKNMWIRSLWSLIMMLVFFVVFFSKQYHSLLVVMLVTMAVFREVLLIACVPAREKKLPLLRLVNWYFFFAANYYLYGDALLRYIAARRPSFLLAVPLAMHHRFISYSIYCLGFVFFVLALKRRYYRFQFQQFAWTHMALLLIVVQGHAILNCIFEGLFWFFLPACLVVANDIAAYVIGFFFGRTRLIQLSPKKTWEGFIGAAVCTLLLGFWLTDVLIRFPYFTCPPTDFDVSFWNHVECEPKKVFLKTSYYLPEQMPYLGGARVQIAPAQFHAMLLAAFAALIAPFGGFFASGIKRAFKIKDFGDMIPGHGGVTDRFDCQFIMGTFAYIYVTSFVGHAGTGDFIHRFMRLTREEQKTVYLQISHLLNNPNAQH